MPKLARNKKTLLEIRKVAKKLLSNLWQALVVGTMRKKKGFEGQVLYDMGHAFRDPIITVRKFRYSDYSAFLAGNWSAIDHTGV